jgi:hypothetical protein
MPKTQKNKSKTYPSAKPKKAKGKPQPASVSITSRKSYWIFLTVTMVVFGSVYGYVMKAAAAAIGMLLISVLFLIGFLYYIKFTPSTLRATERATFIFAGATVIGFLIWVAIVLSLAVTGFTSQIGAAIGNNFFAITSLTICLIGGGFIGDAIGKNKNELKLFLTKIRK